jgi:hypothetical protein
MKILIPQWVIDTIDYPKKLHKSLTSDKNKKLLKTKQQLYEYVKLKAKRFQEKDNSGLITKAIGGIIGVTMVGMVASNISSTLNDQLQTSNVSTTATTQVINMLPAFFVVGAGIAVGLSYFTFMARE